MSDLHLAEEASLLTKLDEACDCVATARSPVLDALLDALESLLADQPTRPTLILNGDVLDLAFASFSRALTIFEHFLARIAVPGRELFSRILFIPGNHDHHIWEIARETQFVTRALVPPLDGEFPPNRHSTPLDPALGVVPYGLGQLVRHVRGLPPGAALDYDLRVSYPNALLTSPDGERAVLIHHGHYAEPLYHAISYLHRALIPDAAPPRTVDEIEAHNFAWIDFIWSVLGRSGTAGSEVGALYKRLHHPRHLDAYIKEAAARLAAAIELPYLPFEGLRRKVFTAVLKRVAAAIAGERQPWGGSSEPVLDGLCRYVFGPVWRQHEGEHGPLPGEVSVLFGHTHRPFETTVRGPSDTPVHVLNTGGWTVDTTDPDPNRGASVVLLDDHLHPAALHVHGESDDFTIHVRQPEGITAPGRAFGDAIRAALTDSAPFRALEDEVRRQTAHRRAHLARRYR